MHGEDGIDDKVFALHGLRDFVHQFGVEESAVIVQCQRVTRVQQMVLRKIDHVLPFGGRAAQGIKFHPICAAANLLLVCHDFPMRPFEILRFLQCIGLYRVRSGHHPVEQGLVQI